jgi:acyl carrier protein
MEDFIIFIASVLKVNPLILSPKTAYGSLAQWNSIMHLRLIMEIEDKYNVEIPIDKVPSSKSIEQLYSYVAGR